MVVMVNNINLEKIKRLLGLAMRSRNLVAGEYISLDNIKRSKAKLVIISEDISENTKKRIINKCNYRKIPFVSLFDRNELGNILGKEMAVVVAVTDKNFAEGIINELGGI